MSEAPRAEVGEPGEPPEAGEGAAPGGAGAASGGTGKDPGAAEGPAPSEAGAPSRRGPALVFLVALAARLAVVAWAAERIPPAADGSFYHTIASRIARGLGYTWLWPDGAVTNAGHYPIGYPALVGAVYAIAGPHPAAAMLLNALIGALAAPAAYVLAGRAWRAAAPEGGRSSRAGASRAALLAGLLVALHPGLVAYTPALMTEGVTASLVACAAWAASEGAARSSRAGAAASSGLRWAIVTGVIAGIATLVRPQSLVLAPIFGWLAAASIRPGARPWLARGLCAAAALAAALAVCAPWTARNCVQMKRCALVSHNGGWNLLIGTNERGDGGWAEVVVPPECREVFDEAEKDVCFGRAARRIVLERPGPWLALAPKKLAMTFDYAGAGGWYLHAASPPAFPERAKVTLGAIETVFERLLLLLALFAAARGSLARLRGRGAKVVREGAPGVAEERFDVAGPARGSSPGAGSARWWSAAAARDVAAVGLGLAGVLSALTRHAWIAYAALGVLLLAARPARGEPAEGSGPVLPAATAAVLLSLVAIHAVFFGAGRYSLVVFPLVTAVAALAFVGPRRSRRGDCRRALRAPHSPESSTRMGK